MSFWRKETAEELEERARGAFEAGRRPGEKHWNELTDDQRSAWREFLEQSKPAI